MKYGEINTDQAQGALLAHSVRTPDVVFKKGRKLSAGDIAGMEKVGINSVVAVILEDGDVPEDEAAESIALASCGDGAEISAPFTGRCNLYAECRGLAVIDRDRVNDLNRLDEALTVATVPPYLIVEKGQMLATVKIIPFSAPAQAVDAGVAIAAGDGPLVRVAPFRPKQAGLIMTRLGNASDKGVAKTANVTKDRLAALGGVLAFEEQCEHSADAVAQSLNQALEAGCDLLLVFGASAIVDRRDVIPAGIEAAGGRVEHFGMPVDPGNLLLLGRHGGVPVIGLPGCARSPKINGFDLVLQRLCADLSVTRADITDMGAGGLLKEIHSRPQPRDGEISVEHPHRARIAALVLAAGQSRRMGAVNKMTADAGGAPMIARSVDAVLASSADPVIVVTGFEHAEVEAALEGRDVTFVHNPDFADGLSTSLRRGLDALPAGTDGAVCCLGDMPAVDPRHIDKLIAAYDAEEGRLICVPIHKGKRGNPVLWGAELFSDMRGVAGDVGARHLIGENAKLVCEVDIEDDAVLLDLDTPEALAAYRNDTR